MAKEISELEDQGTDFKAYLRMLSYLKGKWGYFSLSLIGFFIFALSQPGLAKLMELVIESIEAQSVDARFALPLFAVGIFVVRGVGYYLGNYYNELVGASVVRQVKLDLFSHLTTLPAKFYDQKQQGTLLHNLHNSVNHFQATVTSALKTLIREGLTIIALVAYVFYLNWQLSLVFIFIAPVLAFMVSATGKKFRKISRKNEGALGKAMQVSKDLIGNYGVVRSFGAQGYEKTRYVQAVDRAYKTQLKIRRLASIFTPLTQLVIACAMAVIIFLLLSPDTLTRNSTGDLIGYLTAVALLPKSIRQLSGVSVQFQRGLVGAEIIFGLLDTPPESDLGDYETDQVKGHVAVNNLNFQYPDTEEPVLKNINFEVQPGEMVALVGHSGSGKSTLANLLYRLYDVADNQIFLDGVDVNRYRLENLRKHIAPVNQSITLFDDNVRNNIAYGNHSFSDAQIWDALKQANAADYVASLPQGLDTEIGENGVKLSGGQRQRLSIARAFLKAAPVLILDEATSALDNESEALITESLETLAQSRTTIVIAHRLSTIVKADRLLVMKGGEIVEAGTHTELLAKGQVYSSLYQTEYKDSVS